jgi:hypothetical protein
MLMENMSFGAFSAVPHCQDHPAVVGEILVSIWCVLQAKSQATPQANQDALWSSIAAE